MLYREVIAVCSQIHTKHINTLCRQNVELLNVKLAVHMVTTVVFNLANTTPSVTDCELLLSCQQTITSISVTLRHICACPFISTTTRKQIRYVSQHSKCLQYRQVRCQLHASSTLRTRNELLQFLAVSCYLLPHRPKSHPQRSVLQRFLSSPVLLLLRQTAVHQNRYTVQ